MKEPVRLNKKESIEDRMEAFAVRHAPLILRLIIILLLILFVCVCFCIVGLSAVESGYLKNFINII